MERNGRHSYQVSSLANTDGVDSWTQSDSERSVQSILIIDDLLPPVTMQWKQDGRNQKHKPKKTKQPLKKLIPEPLEKPAR